MSECATCDNGYNCITCSNSDYKPPYCSSVGFYTVYKEDEDVQNQIVNNSLI